MDVVAIEDYQQYIEHKVKTSEKPVTYEEMEALINQYPSPNSTGGFNLTKTNRPVMFVSKEFNMFVLMHEAFHATLEILCGMYSEPLNPTGPHEQFAYMQEYIVHTIMEEYYGMETDRYGK